MGDLLDVVKAKLEEIDEMLVSESQRLDEILSDLEEKHASELNDAGELDLPEIKPMTVAEIFNADKVDYTEEKKRKKIGF